MITKVIEWLNKNYDMDIDPSYYSKIETWRKRWTGELNGFNDIDRSATPKTDTNYLYSLKMAKKVCEDWASLLINEKVIISTDDEPTNNYLDKVLFDIQFQTRANQLVEKAMYSGTGAFLIRVNGATLQGATLTAGESISLQYLPAQNIIPLSIVDETIIDCAFVTTKVLKGKTKVFVEIHSSIDTEYRIDNLIFSTDKANTMLQPEPLPKDIPQTVLINSKIPLFAIIKPNVINTFCDNGLGMSIYANATDVLKAIDFIFNNFCRDFRLGGKKVFYRESALRLQNEDGKTMTADEALQQLLVAIGEDSILDEKFFIQEFNPSLRVADNKEGLQTALDYLAQALGFGAKHYRIDEGGQAVTATQYSGDRQELRQNARKHSLIINEAIKQTIQSLLWIAKNILGNNTVNPDATITIDGLDGYIISDDERKAQFLLEIDKMIRQPWEYRVEFFGETEAQAKAAIASNNLAAAEFGNSTFNEPDGPLSS